MTLSSKSLIGLALLIVLTTWTLPAQAESPVGVYVGQVSSQQIELKLNADGSASLLGERGRWQANAGGFILSGAEGSVQATLRSGVVVFTVDGVRIELRKRGKSVPRRAQPAVARTNAGGKFSPKKLLKGKRFKVSGVNASFVLPKGWSARYVEQDGESGISITNRRHPDAGIFLLAKVLSSSEMAMSVPQLLKQGAREALGDTPAQVVSGPIPFSVDGKEAGMMVLEGSNGIRTIRARLAGVRIGRWGATFVALYDAKFDAQLAPVFDTVVATFKGKAPKENKALTAKLAGCWEQYHRDSGLTGSGVNSTTYRFDRQGNYSYRYYMSVSIPNGAGVSDKSQDSGRFFVAGGQLMLQSNKGESSNMAVQYRGGRLTLGSASYIPCS